MESIVRDKKVTINAMNKIAFGILLAIAAQGYSEHVKADDTVPSSKENDMVLDKLKVEGASNAQEGDWVYDELHSVSEISREQLDNRPRAMRQIY